MNLENGSFARCVRHPSQLFTGFCSSCLVERLSNIDTVERSRKPSRPLGEVVNLSLSISDFERRPRDVRVRKTLLSLFHLDEDDSFKTEVMENAMKGLFQMENSIAGEVRFPENRYVGPNFDPEARVPESKGGPETSAFSSYGAVEEPTVDTIVMKKPDPGEDENLKQKGVSFWLGSMFSKKVLEYRMRSAFKKNLLHQRNYSGGFEEEWLETKHNFRHFCDRKVSCDSGKVSWEDRRHSWDGSMMSRAFACSFSCVEEAEDGTFDNLRESDGLNLSISQRSKRSLPDLTEEVILAYPKPSATTTYTNNSNNMSLSVEEPLSPRTSRTKPLRDRFLEESHQDITVPRISRRKSHRWSKVWNWSTASPFRDTVQNQEHFLERSLSESWRESRKGKYMETNSESELHFYGNGVSRVNHVLNSSKNTGNGDLHALRPDWQMKKREYKLGRSRSAHYSSPRNLDNGLLRFYLTPLRSSRRNTNRGRMKTSCSFGRGIFGFY